MLSVVMLSKVAIKVADFATAVSYKYKMFVKLTTGVSDLKLLYFIADKEDK